MKNWKTQFNLVYKQGALLRFDHHLLVYAEVPTRVIKLFTILTCSKLALEPHEPMQ